MFPKVSRQPIIYLWFQSMFCILFGAFSKSTKIPTSTIKISPVVYIQKIILVTLNFKYLNGDLNHKNNEPTTKKTETDSF